jgi:hypothetical protein
MLVLMSAMALSVISATSTSAQVSYNPALRRYPYLTDAVGSAMTINWATDRSEISGGVRFGKVGAEACTAHYVPATKTSIIVNGVSEYQWKAMLDLAPDMQYCYRVYLGTSPLGEIDLLGSDPDPVFRTQISSGGNQTFSFIVFGDWGQVDASGANSHQANLMSLMATSGARFAVTTGDNGYPDGSQKNMGDLIQTGLNVSAVFGPSFWKVPGAALPIFPVPGNHGYSSVTSIHPQLLTWPQDRAVSTSAGRYVKETYCCLDSTISKSYPSTWYAFDSGPARFYMLNAAWDESNLGTASEYQVDYDYHWAPSSAQYQWLQADLAAHPSILKFAFFHYPLYSDNPNEPTDTFLLGANSLEGLLKQNGVDIAFTGHSHVYERNSPSSAGITNYITGAGGATLGTLGTCTALDAYAIKFTTTGKSCGSAPAPTNAGQVYHFLLVTINGQNVTVNPINALGESFDVVNYNFSTDAETTPPSTPADLTASSVSGTQINLSWSAASDNTGVRGYGIYRNGILIGTVDQNTLTYSDDNLTLATDYTYQIDSYDGSANHSALSATMSATTQSSATYILSPVADAYVAGDVTSTNYGNSSLLKADGSPDYRSYIRFNVGELNGTVTNATLRLYTSTSSATGYQVHHVNTQSWEEGSLNFGNAPGVGTLIGSSGKFASGSWTSVDVTSLITGNGVYDLAITNTTSTAFYFNSRDASLHRPELIIQTSSGVVTSTPTSTSTETAITTGILMFNAEADARVNQASATTNYGTSTTLQVDGDAGVALVSFIRFTTNGIGAPIQSVKLRIYCTTNGTVNGPAIYLADNNWIESGTGGVTWNTQPTLLSGVVDNKGAFGTNVWVEYDVTSLVTGNGTYSFALVADGNDGMTFSAREGALPPQLFVTLGTPPTATLTPTLMIPTVTRTPTPTPTSTAIGNTPTFTPTPTVGSSNSLTFTTEADARVVQTVSATNYGSSTNIQVDGDTGAAQISYIRFTVTEITGPIQSVKLRVNCTTNGTANGPAAYLADSNWIEGGAGGVTWDTQPTILSSAFDNKGVIATDAWVEYDVTALVTGDGTYTFALIADGNDGVTFSSREGSTAPQLLVQMP